MSIVHSPDSEYAKEMTKWEAYSSSLGPGLRPYERRDYPMMLHKAAQLPRGGLDIVEWVIVDDADHRALREREGFRATPLEALAALEAEQFEAAALAAEREHEKRHGLSAKAVAEVNAVEAAAGAKHLATIQETPIRRRGRPRKAVETQETS